MGGRKWVPWLVVGLLLLAIGGTVLWAKVRGYRNNNPGNIRKGADKWQGLAAETDQSDPDFWRFLAPEWGIRALRKTLETYHSKYGLSTINGIIARWAPPGENDTTAYVKAVAKSTGLAPDAVLSYPDDLDKLVRAIITHELGFPAAIVYPDATIQKGLTLP